MHARPAAGRRSAAALHERSAALTLDVADDLAAVEQDWRAFEREADGTAFQTFDWLAAWQRHIGQHAGVTPLIVTARYADGRPAMIAPLALEAKGCARRLSWLGQALCDYNAPLLARDFSEHVGRDDFLVFWRELLARLQSDPRWRYDWIAFEQMPQTIGKQANPFTFLETAINPSGAHLTELGADWKSFYAARRSSATRRRDRAKWRHMSRYGAIRFTTSATAEDARHTVERLIDQKSRFFAQQGIADIFARPGHRDFYLDLASNPRARGLVHIGRTDIGGVCAAANFGLVHGGRYYHVLASFDRALEVARYGPGVLHQRMLMEYATGLGLREFDFTIGDEPYKQEWSDVDLTLYDYTSAATWRGRIACGYADLVRPLKRVVKQTPLLWRLATRSRALFGRLRLRGAEARAGGGD